ncbi:hypothetical protein NQ176_g9747 [Zarea fungicola]|uniref:Uncharacterized protein n=1 Tax=Zarea fungicola TaxID=93591 RepID=A0ACC1MK05_9HYPO|nr:hypothetical protein NQ176_g9747 [Lecanicillium fungicola]
MERTGVLAGRVRRPRRKQMSDEEERQLIRSIEEELKAESNRREALSPLERLREDGQILQKQIEANTMPAVLQTSPTQGAKAKCRARDCLLGQRYGHFHVPIIDEHRIRIYSSGTPDYYHVRCFSLMVDVHALIPSKFVLNGGLQRWPLMVQEWYQQKGHVNMDKIAAYVEEQEAYNEAEKERNVREIDWQLAHMRSCPDEAEIECKCPPRHTCPVKPIPPNFYTGEREVCSLEEILKHPGCRFVDGGPVLWV